MFPIVRICRCGDLAITVQGKRGRPKKWCSSVCRDHYTNWNHYWNNGWRERKSKKFGIKPFPCPECGETVTQDISSRSNIKKYCKTRCARRAKRRSDWHKVRFTKKFSDDVREKNRERYYRKKSQGICVSCSEPATFERVHCERCAQRMRAYVDGTL